MKERRRLCLIIAIMMISSTIGASNIAFAETAETDVAAQPETVQATEPSVEAEAKTLPLEEAAKEKAVEKEEAAEQKEADGESVKETAKAETKGEAAEKKLPTTFTYENKTMAVTAVLSDANALPEGAEFIVKETGRK